MEVNSNEYIFTKTKLIQLIKLRMMTRTYFFISVLILFSSCSGSKKTISQFDLETADHQRIAVVPFQSKINLTKKQQENVTAQQLKELNIAQGKEVQNAVESYLIGQKLRVRVQSQSVTNSKLKTANIDFEKITDVDVTKLASILGVDAVVVGLIETEQPMSDELARGLDVAKGLARQAGGLLGNLSRGVSTTTNKGSCSLGLFEKVHGDRLWNFSDDLELGAGSNIKDVIEKLMNRGAKKFPYKK